MDSSDETLNEERHYFTKVVGEIEHGAAAPPAPVNLSLGRALAAMVARGAAVRVGPRSYRVTENIVLGGDGDEAAPGLDADGDGAGPMKLRFAPGAGIVIERTGPVTIEDIHISCDEIPAPPTGLVRIA